jgi:hypothetical protein
MASRGMTEKFSQRFPPLLLTPYSLPLTSYLVPLISFGSAGWSGSAGYRSEGRLRWRRRQDRSLERRRHRLYPRRHGDGSTMATPAAFTPPIAHGHYNPDSTSNEKAVLQKSQIVRQSCSFPPSLLTMAPGFKSMAICDKVA